MRKKIRMNVEENTERLPVSRCRPDVGTGLTQEQVQVYAQAGWTNRAVALVMLTGSFHNLTFLVVVLANLLIGIVQEIRAKRTLDKLSMLNAPRAIVVRDGKKQEIPAETLVLDDIVFFQAGKGRRGFLYIRPDPGSEGNEARRTVGDAPYS